MLVKKSLIHFVTLAASVAACGGNDKATQDKAEPVKQTVSTGEVAELDSAPEFLIVKVPVSADGVEQNENFETREFSAPDSFNSAAATETAFNAGSNAEVLNELDTDSSSEQFNRGRTSWYWNTAWYPGKLLGRGLWWGRNPYRSSGGFQYGYNHYRNYTSNGCNYYVYQRPATYPTQSSYPGQYPTGQNYPDQQYPGQSYPASSDQGYQGGYQNQNDQDGYRQY